MKGVVKKLDERKFGFISVEGGNDVFFHANECEDGVFDTLNEGDTVTFDTADSEKGPKAVNVRLDAGGGEEAAPEADAAPAEAAEEAPEAEEAA